MSSLISTGVRLGPRPRRPAGSQIANETRHAFALAAGEGDSAGMIAIARALVSDLFTSPEKQSGRRPIHWAARDGDTNAIELCLEHGATVGDTDSDGCTAVHYAAGNGELMAVQLLVDGHSADSDVAGGRGCTPLHLVADKGFCGIAKFLLARKANVHSLSADEQTPLHMAAMGGQTAMISLLLDAGADINAQCTSDRRTALHEAAVAGHVDAFLALYNAGASLEIVDQNGDLALSLARYAGLVDETVYLQAARS
jgi:ankyrin repeat protein